MRNVNEWQRQYNKTLNGHIRRTYANIKGRVVGYQKTKAHIYLGLPLLSRDEFYRFSFQNKNLIRLYSAWEMSGFDRKLTPSIDRVIPENGYIIGNIKWITHSENSGKIPYLKRASVNDPKYGARSHLSKLSEEQAIFIINNKGYLSAKCLSKKFSVCLGTVYEIWSGRTWPHLKRK